MSDDTLRLLRRLRTDPEFALAEMAEALRSGQPDPLLISALAQMIDPKAGIHPFGVRLKAEQSRAGAPKKPANLELGRFISERLEVEEKVEAVIAEARERFGVSRSTAFKVLREFRDFQLLRRAYNELVERDRSPKK